MNRPVAIAGTAPIPLRLQAMFAQRTRARRQRSRSVHDVAGLIDVCAKYLASIYAGSVGGTAQSWYSIGEGDNNPRS
jgi:hypothetical protein